MTEKQMNQVVTDHSELGQPLKVVKNGENDYSVYAECSDGVVEINPKQEEDMATPQEDIRNAPITI